MSRFPDSSQAGASAKSGLTIVILAVIAVAALLVLGLGSNWGTPDSQATEQVEQPSDSGSDGTASAATKSKDLARTEAQAAPRTTTADRIVGKVISSDGLPVAGAQISIRYAGEATIDPSLTTDERGQFEHRILEQRIHVIRAAVDAIAVERSVPVPLAKEVVLQLPANPTSDPVALIVLARDSDGLPVAAAEVEAVGSFPGHPIDSRHGGTVRRGTTDRNGRCAFNGQPCPEAVIVVRGPRGRAGLGIQYPHSMSNPLEVEVVLTDQGSLFGNVVVHGASGPLEESTVVARYGTAASRFGSLRFEAPVRDGQYRFDSLPTGAYTLAVKGVAEQGLHLCGLDSQGQVSTQSNGWVEPVRATITATESTRLDLELASAAAIEGTVQSETGATSPASPIPGARVTWSRLLAEGRKWNEAEVVGVPVDRPGETERTDSHGTVVTDAQGRYSIIGLLPGGYRITVFASGFARASDSSLQLAGGKTATRDFSLGASGAIEGVVGHSAIVAIWPETDLPHSRVGPTQSASGMFRFEDLNTGRYAVSVVEHEDLARSQQTIVDPPPILAVVDVQADQTTFVDLRQSLPVHLEGQLLGGHGPFAHATLSLRGRESITDEQGRFSFRFATPVESALERVLLLQGNVTMGMLLPDAARGATSWSGQLQIETRSTTLSTLSARQEPVAARILLAGHAIGELTTDPLTGTATLQLPPDTIGATVEFPSGVRMTRSFRGGDAVEFREPDHGELVVVVTDAAGKPLRRAKVLASTWVGEGTPPAGWDRMNQDVVVVDGHTNAAGELTLRGVRSGTVRVTKQRMFSVDGNITPAKTAEINLPSGGSLQVRLALSGAGK